MSLSWLKKTLGLGRDSIDLDGATGGHRGLTKRIMYRSLLVVFLLTMLAANCAPFVKYTPGTNISDLQSRNVRDGENILPSGRKIVVNNVTKMDFADGRSALVLNYSTTVSIDNKKDLRSEIDEIWPSFVQDVEAKQLKAAALRPVNGSKGYGFLFEKRDDGSWYCHDDEKK